MINPMLGLIYQCEMEYGNISNIPLFDERMIKIRKYFNDGKDPFEFKYYDFDFKSAQLMLNQGIDKERIANELGVTVTSLNCLIRMGNLNSSKWLENHDEQLSRTGTYNLIREHKKIATGTIRELSEFMKVPIEKIRYWKSARYKPRSHKVTYRVSQVS